MSAIREVATVRIRGRTYRLAGLPPERARPLAAQVDRALALVSPGKAGPAGYDHAVLAALHIADELADERATLAKLRLQVWDTVGRVLEGVEASLADSSPLAAGETVHSEPQQS